MRDDSFHPSGTLVVDRYNDAGVLLAYPLGGGFGVTIPASEVRRFTIVTKEEATPIYKIARFAIEGLGDGSFEGWTTGERWNGWAKPLFSKVVGMQLVAALDGQLRYDSPTDAFIDTSTEEQEIWHAQTIELPDGGNVKVYGIGSGFWIWDAI